MKSKWAENQFVQLIRNFKWNNNFTIGKNYLSNYQKRFGLSRKEIKRILRREHILITNKEKNVRK